jgi:hypothetical protein
MAAAEPSISSAGIHYFALIVPSRTDIVHVIVNDNVQCARATVARVLAVARVAVQVQVVLVERAQVVLRALLYQRGELTRFER